MYKYFEFITEHKDKGDPHDLLQNEKNIEYSSQQKSSSITSEDLL